MKISKVLLSAILGMALVTTSCQKDAMQQNNDKEAANTSPEANRSEKASGILTWQGEYMSDGCGFAIEIDGKKYKPENEDAIPASFKTESVVSVEVEFERLNEQIDRRCGLSPESRAMDGIRILSITRK